MVHGGVERSQHGETSDAIFMNSGYVYPTSGAAERRFKNEEPGHIYSRFSNPSVEMFQQRMAMLEGAEAARGVATGMAAVTTAVMAQVRAGDHVVACPRSVRRLPLRDRGLSAALGRRLDAGRWPRSEEFRSGDAPQYQADLHRDADQSDA